MINRYQLLPNLNIEKVIFNGLGLAHYHDSSVLIYQGLPGDNVDVTVVHKRGNTYFAEIKKYNSHSKYYNQPSCPHFDDCGGCDWLNVDYKDQLFFKQHIFEEVFKGLNIGTLQEVSIKPSPIIDRYRNKIILPVISNNKTIKAGMYARRSHKVITHNVCHLHPQNTDEIIAATCELLTKGGTTVYNESTQRGNLRFIGVRYSPTCQEHLLIIVTKTRKLPFSKLLCEKLSEAFPSLVGIVQDINSPATNRNISSDAKLLYGRSYLIERLKDKLLNINYSSFFQVNTHQCINILTDISQYLTKDDSVIDAYSGIGTIGISIADVVQRVICLEHHPEAVKNGISNITANNLNNCSYLAGKVEVNLEGVLAKAGFSTLIVDPPRKGLDASIILVITDSSISKIIYLSCNLATQKRDLKLLMDIGFKIKAIQPYDMFPHTHHIECLVVLRR